MQKTRRKQTTQDVYKRQEKKNAAVKADLECISIWTTMEVPAPMSGWHPPVSDTHLDVYKRQGIDRATETCVLPDSHV